MAAKPRKYQFGEIEGEYDAKSYFDKKFLINPDLRASGHRRFPLNYNQAMYQVATDRLKSMLQRNQITLTDKRILDIGPGVGYFVEKYIDWGAKEIVGVDITPTSVKLLTARFPAHVFFEGDFSEKNIQPGNDFDQVYAISVVFHITKDERFLTALENMCKSVKPGGYLIIVDTFSKPIISIGKHVRFRPLEAYMQILNKMGFTIIEKTPMYYVMGVSFVPFLLPKILSWPPVLRQLVRFDYWLGNHSLPSINPLKYLIVQRPG